MATPVVTDKWAGNFDCDLCRRKRLIGDEFSKKVCLNVCVLPAPPSSHLTPQIFDCKSWQALEKYRREGGKLKCKQCVQQGEEAERKAAAARRAVTSSSTSTDQDDGAAQNQEKRKCSGGCNMELDYALFNRNQWNKGEGKARCRACVDEAVAKEQASQNQGKDEKLAAARQKVEMANASGNAQAILKAESELAAFEAEKVTGLKPVKMGGRGGGGRGAGRGRGGRSGRGSGRGI